MKHIDDFGSVAEVRTTLLQAVENALDLDAQTPPAASPASGHIPRGETDERVPAPAKTSSAPPESSPSDLSSRFWERARGMAPFVAAATGFGVWISLFAASAFQFPGRDAATMAVGTLTLLLAFVAVFQQLEALRRSVESFSRPPPPTAGSGGQAPIASDQDIQSEVVATSKGDERSNARERELSRLVRAEVSSLAASSAANQQLLQGLISEIAAQRKAISASGEHVRAAIAGAHADVASNLEKIGAKIPADLARIGERMAGADATANVADDRSSEPLSTRQARCFRELEEVAAALIERIDAAGERAVDAIVAQSISTQERFVEKLREALAHWVSVTQFASQKFIGAASEAIVAVSISGETLSGTVASNLTAFDEEVVARSGALANVLAERTTQLETQLRSLEALIGAGNETVVERIALHAERIEHSVSGHVGAIDAVLAKRRSELEQGMVARNEEFAAAIDQGLDKTDARATERLREIGAMLDALVQRVDQDLAARGKALTENLAQTTIRASRALGDSVRETTMGIDATSTRAARNLETRAETLTRTLSGLADRIYATLQGKFDQLSGTFDGGVSRLQSDVVAPLRAVAERLDSSGAELAATAVDHAKALDGIVSAHEQAMRRSFANEADLLTGKLAERTEALLRDLTSAIVDADAALTSSGQDIAQRVGTRIEELRNLLDGEGAEFVARLEARGDQVSGQIASVGERSLQSFDQKVTGLIALLTRRGDDLLSAMNAGASESARKVAALTGQISRGEESSTKTTTSNAVY